ncbi:pentapeptide repeat-containing protein [Leptolyngbya sp. FACHB-321]|nr:pentapeptide repeat-containing protein [Leptolyngbya sp. FACHB-321]
MPLSLAVLGYWLQQLQQKRTEEVTREQRELAEEETREEVLQGYFDRLAMLLVDKNLVAIVTKVNAMKIQETGGQPPVQVTTEDQELLDSAVEVIRARTLSILRRFQNDSARKTSVVHFLIEADIISKLKLSLRGADFSHANLNGANLNGADLRSANLSGADLRGANLGAASLAAANLSHANLENANFNYANLSGADLSGADLSFTTFQGANLGFANLSFTKVRSTTFQGAKLGFANLHGADLDNSSYLSDTKLEGTKLCRTTLPVDSKLDPDRDCKELGVEE